MYAIDLSNGLNSVNIFHVNIISWDVVHVKLWLKMYLHHDFVANLIFAKWKQTYEFYDSPPKEFMCYLCSICPIAERATINSRVNPVISGQLRRKALLN
jgi:hypothetical protein